MKSVDSLRGEAGGVGVIGDGVEEVGLVGLKGRGGGSLERADLIVELVPTDVASMAGGAGEAVADDEGLSVGRVAIEEAFTAAEVGLVTLGFGDSIDELAAEGAEVGDVDLGAGHDGEGDNRSHVINTNSMKRPGCGRVGRGVDRSSLDLDLVADRTAEGRRWWA
jgi:hypothetical protein